MQDTRFGDDDKRVGIALRRIVEQRGRTADIVGDQQHGLFAFRMCQHFGFGVLFFQFDNLLEGEFLMHMARTVPYHHIASGNALDVIAQVAVRRKDDLGVHRQ